MNFCKAGIMLCSLVSLVQGRSDLPAQSVFVDPKSFAALGPDGPFRNSSFDEFFNPTKSNPPFFQIFDLAFLDILGPNPSFDEIASNDSFPFAHEAPIYVAESDEFFFASNDGGLPGVADLNHNNFVGKISMKEVEEALAKAKSRQKSSLSLPDTVQMTNGGTGPFKSSLVLITSGRGELPPSIVLVNPNEPHNTTVVLDNFFGRQFNALNDVKIHPASGAFFFTDSVYGALLGFRPPPQLPNQVYRLDPATGAVRVVATDFVITNGIAFTPDGKMATDTGSAGGTPGMFAIDQTKPATIYAFDVDPKTQVFMNRRVFAYSDTGIPDGIQVDAAGNVYSGCGEGVHVWSPEGTLLGKFFVGNTTANMGFAGDGRLVILAANKVFLAKIAAKEGRESKNLDFNHNSAYMNSNSIGIISLPFELIHSIFELCSRDTLTILARTHPTLRLGAESLLYHTVDSERALHTLSKSAEKARLVRRLIVYMHLQEYVGKLSKALLNMRDIYELRLGLIFGSGRMNVGWVGWAHDVEEILCTNPFPALRILRCNSHDMNLARIIQSRPELQVVSTNFLPSDVVTSLQSMKTLSTLPIIYTLKRARHDLEVNEVGLYPPFYPPDLVSLSGRFFLGVST
ncbi:calcium-dependent phosphotriesterase [Agrocybe pediades]|nr:calcium-dependent phosphotriesterase [Agrocybe pediades]